MKVLALDPSSTCVGYAVLATARQLLDAGRLTPTRERDDANARIRAMAADLRRVLAEYPDAVVVVEDTSGKVGRGRHGGGGAGLAVYGKALGYLIRVVEEATGREPALVLENVWTAGKSKAVRQRRVAATFPGYPADDDPGGDVADAIGLAAWWIDEERRAAMVAAADKKAGR